MKLILKITVLDRILEEVAKARRINREPDCIVLTHAEYAELLVDYRIRGYMDHTFSRVHSPAETPSDPSMTTRDFQCVSNHPSYGFRQSHRAISREKIMGYPLYVVPVEYHPA